MSGITRAQSGQRYTAVGSATGLTRRADYIGGDVALPTDERGADHWFNTAAFKTAPTTALGNAGVGMILGPGLYIWDTSIRKEFAWGESKYRRIQFRADAFNVMNHVNFRSLQVTTSSSNFGTLTGSGPARNLQGELKDSVLRFLVGRAPGRPVAICETDPIWSRRAEAHPTRCFAKRTQFGRGGLSSTFLFAKQTQFVRRTEAHASGFFFAKQTQFVRRTEGHSTNSILRYRPNWVRAGPGRLKPTPRLPFCETDPIRPGTCRPRPAVSFLRNKPNFGLAG